MISKQKFLQVDSQSYKFLDLVTIVHEGFDQCPPERDQAELEVWLETTNRDCEWLARLRQAEQDVCDMIAAFMKLNPREAVQQEVLVGIERVGQRILAGRHGSQLEVRRAVARNIGSYSHLHGFLNQHDVHGKHPMISSQVKNEWLRISGVNPSEWHCEPTAEVGFIGRILFAAPKVLQLWKSITEFDVATYADARIPLLDGVLLHVMVSRPDHLRKWLDISIAHEGNMSEGLNDPSFRELLSGLSRHAKRLLQENDLDRIIEGVQDLDGCAYVLNRLCGVFEFSAAWYLCLELFYMLGPDNILDGILLICPDEEDECYQASALA